MTIIFHDIQEKMPQQIIKDRVINANFDQVLFADDTICISENAESLTKRLHLIQEEGGKYGLQLNLDKCELIRISRTTSFTEKDNVFFKNGQKVNIKDEAKYLGCWLNYKGDPTREVRQRITVCMTILKKLDLYWFKANPSIKEKLQVYDAIIKSKLLYGLESAPMNESTKHELDIFQLKGLRKILGIKTTFVDKTQDNKTIYRKVQQHIHENTKSGKPERQIKPMSQVYEERKTQLLNSIICSPEGSPTRVLTFQPNTLQPTEIHDNNTRKRRSGHPRVKWVDTTLENLWTLIKTEMPQFRYSPLNLSNPQHIEAIKLAAGTNLHEITPGYIIRD